MLDDSGAANRELPPRTRSRVKAKSLPVPVFYLRDIQQGDLEVGAKSSGKMFAAPFSFPRLLISPLLAGRFRFVLMVGGC